MFGFKVFFINILFFSTTWAANILYLSLTASPSHTIWDKTLAVELAKNHQVTFVSHVDIKGGKNVTSIILEGVLEKMHEDFSVEEFFDISIKAQVDVLFEWMHGQSMMDAETKGFKNLVKRVESREKFDLVLMDITTGHFLFPLIAKMNFPPLIFTSAFGIQIFHSRHFGFDFHTSYIPIWCMEFGEDMTFFQRASNLILTLYGLYVRTYQYYPAEIELGKKVFGDIATPELFDKIDKHASLLLANNDPIMDFPQPMPPSIIHVGGMHVKRVTALPEDLKKIMDESKDGVILFCLGTNVRSDSIKKEQRDGLINGLAKLKQTVIWKFESQIENLPKNIIVRQWVPQNEILAHPNLKLFISHGGALSTQEAMYHGVPIVGIPFFADQISNMYKILNKKLGVKLSYFTLTEKKVYAAVTEVLNNPMYKNNMRLISQRYRDQPQNALEKAVFWTEYAIRNKGAQHLRIKARDLPSWKLYMLDVWGAFLALILLILFIFYKLFTRVFKRRCPKDKVKKQ